MDELRTYRHDVSGRVGRFHPRVAEADGHLVEVPEGTKPLVRIRITDELREQMIGSPANENATQAESEAAEVIVDAKRESSISHKRSK